SVAIKKVHTSRSRTKTERGKPSSPIQNTITHRKKVEPRTLPRAIASTSRRLTWRHHPDRRPVIQNAISLHATTVIRVGTRRPAKSAGQCPSKRRPSDHRYAPPASTTSISTVSTRRWRIARADQWAQRPLSGDGLVGAVPDVGAGTDVAAVGADVAAVG